MKRIATIIIVCAALCATATATPADSLRTVHVDEVQVEAAAPKESYRLAEQPLAATSFDAAALAVWRARSLDALSAAVPGFVMPRYGSRLTSAMYVRGVGARSGAPAVGLYVDNIPVLCKSAYNRHFASVAGLDVVRGPEATLYGQNTEGGMARLTTRDPLHVLGTILTLGGGSFATRHASLDHYMATGQHAALALGAWYEGTNGYRRDANTHRRADNGNEAGAHLRWAWTPTEAWRLDLTADYQHTQQHAFAYGQTGGCDLQSQDKAYTATASCSPQTTTPNTYRRDILLAAIDVERRLGTVTFHSTTSFQFLDDDMDMDQDYTAADFLHLHQQQRHHALTEELTAKGSALGGRWHWVAGAYFARQWLRTEAPIRFGADFTAMLADRIGGQMRQAMIASMTAKGLTQQQAAAMVDRMGVGVDGVEMPEMPATFRTPQTNAALFHEGHYDLTPSLRLSLGLRWDYAHTAVAYTTSTAMTLSATVAGVSRTSTLSAAWQNATAKDYHTLLPHFALTYTLPGTRHTLYATAAKGSRDGGYNIQMFADIMQKTLQDHSAEAQRGDCEIVATDDDYAQIARDIAYAPETSWNMEAGTHLRFSCGLELDAAAYHIRITNQQLAVMAPGYGFGRMMVNAGRSTSTGIELSARGTALQKRLALSASYAYCRAVFAAYTETAADGTTLDHSGERVPYTPAHTLAAAADYTFRLGSVSLTPGLRLQALGDIMWDEDGTYRQPFYATLAANCRVAWRRCELNLYGRNLTATRYNTFALDSGATGQTLYFANQGEPREWGAELTVSL